MSGMKKLIHDLDDRGLQAVAALAHLAAKCAHRDQSRAEYNVWSKLYNTCYTERHLRIDAEVDELEEMLNGPPTGEQVLPHT